MVIPRIFLTRRVLATSAAGFLAIALVWLVVRFSADAESARVISLVSTVVLSAFAAGITLAAASRIPVGEALRVRWSILGLGISAYAFGQLVRMYYEVLAGVAAPYPGLADLLFVLSSVFIAYGLFDEVAAIRRIGALNAPLIAALTVSLALLAVEANLLLFNVAADETASQLAKSVSLYRPVAGVLFCVLPATYIVFAMALHGGQLGWPWVPVAIGISAVSLADAAYAWLSWSELYRPGHVIDAVWMVGYMFVALGALMHTEVDYEEPTPAEKTELPCGDASAAMPEPESA